jgi:hypothetical protein
VATLVSPGEAVGRFIKNYPYLVIVIAIILMALAILYASHIYMATGTETLVSTNSQAYKDIEYYDQNFQPTTFLILITSDNVLDPDVLNAMDDLDTQIMTNPKIANVTGLNTYVRQAAKTAYGYDDIPESEADVESLINAAPANMTALLVPDPHHTIMTVTLDGDVSTKQEPNVLADVESDVAFSSMPPGTTAVVTGSTAMMLQVQAEMMKSMAVMLGTAVILMVLALWFTFGHARWRLLPLPIVLVGIIYTGGIMGAASIPLTMVSMAVFPILIGLGVEYAIQFHNRMMEELGSGKSPGDAVVATLRHIGPPVFYSMMTACLGFLAILQSPIPMVYDFGLMCLIGIIVCFLTAILLLTTMIYLFSRHGWGVNKKPVRTNKKAAPASGRMEKVIRSVAEATTKHPSVVVIAILAMIVGYSLDPRVGVEVDTSTFVPQNLPSVIQFRSLNSVIGYKTDTMVIQVKGPDLTTPEALSWIQQFSSFEQQNNPDVLSVSSIVSLLTQYNNGTLPDTTAGVQATLARIPDSMKSQYLDNFMTTGIITMTIISQPTNVEIDMFKEVQDDIKFLPPPPGIDASLGGQTEVSLLTFGSLTSDRLAMTAWGGFCVLLSLLIVFKGDWVRAVVPVLAVTIVTGLSCMVMFLLQMKYTPLSVTLGALTIGIGIDFSILHMERYYEEKAKGLPPAKAMEVATAKIGNAIFSSASTVIAGFGALVMSNFSILSNFGIVTIIDFILALMSAFVIMPPLLVTLDTWQSGRKAKKARTESVRA